MERSQRRRRQRLEIRLRQRFTHHLLVSLRDGHSFLCVFLVASVSCSQFELDSRDFVLEFCIGFLVFPFSCFPDGSCFSLSLFSLPIIGSSPSSGQSFGCSARPIYFSALLVIIYGAMEWLTLSAFQFFNSVTKQVPNQAGVLKFVSFRLCHSFKSTQCIPFKIKGTAFFARIEQVSLCTRSNAKTVELSAQIDLLDRKARFSVLRSLFIFSSLSRPRFVKEVLQIKNLKSRDADEHK